MEAADFPIRAVLVLVSPGAWECPHEDDVAVKVQAGSLPWKREPKALVIYIICLLITPYMRFSILVNY